MIRRVLSVVVLAAIAAFVYLQFAMPSLPAPALSFLAHWSPRAAVRGFLDAAKSDDEAGMKDFASRSSQNFAAMASIVKELKDDWSVGDDFEEEDGTARVRVEHGDTEAVAIAVKEEGGWKVDLVATGAEIFKSSIQKK